MAELAPRRRPRWGALLAYALVGIAAAAANLAIARAGLPGWAGYLVAAVVIFGAIGALEWRRAKRVARPEPDLQLLRSEATREQVLARLRDLERAGRPKAGVGIAIPPGDCKLWIRHVADAFEIHAFSVSPSDAPRMSRIGVLLERAPGCRKLPAEDRPRQVLTFRATLPADAVHGIVVALLDLEGAPGAPVELWWSTTLPG